MKTRRWVFTRNNYPEDLPIKLKNELETLYKKGSVKYAIFGLEIGDSGTPHMQGYIHFVNARTASGLQKMIPGSFHEAAGGSDEHNQNYCSKESIYCEVGTPQKQGERSDIDTIKEMVKDGATHKELYETASSYQAYRFGEIGKRLYAQKRNWKPQVVWLFGDTGTGKSRSCMEAFQNAWVSGQILNGFIFDQYAGESEVILDDLRPQDITFSLMLKVLDRYPMIVRTIGGSIQFVARTIVITTTKPPAAFYNGMTDENVNQLLRRIDVVAKFMTNDVVLYKGCLSDAPWMFPAEAQNTEVGGNNSAPPSRSPETYK